jgi:hypothetical protein
VRRAAALMVVVPVLVFLECTPPPSPPPPPPSDAGVDGGADGGGMDGGGIVTPAGQWTWVPVEGSQCASGSTAGFAINPGTSTDLFLFLQGGGACWNTGTCVPSLVQEGPVCGYSGGICLYSGSGGTQPLASHVTEHDPFPRDARSPASWRSSRRFGRWIGRTRRTRSARRRSSTSPTAPATCTPGAP